MLEYEHFSIEKRKKEVCNLMKKARKTSQFNHFKSFYGAFWNDFYLIKKYKSVL